MVHHRHWENPRWPGPREGVADYLGRLRRTQRAATPVSSREGTEDQVAKRVLEASEGSLRVLLDECGRLQRSTELAAWIGKRRSSAHASTLAF